MHSLKTMINLTVQSCYLSCYTTSSHCLYLSMHYHLCTSTVVEKHLSSAILPAQNFKEEAKKQRQLIQALERERDRYGKDAAVAQQSCISQVCVVNVDGLVGQ